MIPSGDAISRETLERNLQRVRSRIASSAAKSGRSPDAVQLIAVTKYAEIEQIKDLMSMGVTNIGEARVQDAEFKFKTMLAAAPQGGAFDPYAINWHLIGHLQTNKADKAVRIFHAVHSVDSVRLAEVLQHELSRTASHAHPTLLHQVLLEVNVAQDAKKYGLDPKIDEICAVLKLCSELDRMTVIGLMCMAPHSENPEATSRQVFRRLRNLRDEANERHAYKLPLTELSMGMTQDYAIAVEEGATMVRVGSALFGREQNPA
jgi:pyridoxal phosphate enzyme (YggS family)